MTVLGIDISKWNGNWDATKAKSGGASFVIVKASQATFTDIQFAANWRKAKQAGLMRGAFHYLDYTKPGIVQANYFADLLKDDPGELPPVVDYELRRTDNNPAAALAFLREFMDTLLGRTDLFGKMHYKKPMIYMSPGFWKEYGTKSEPSYWTQFPLWLAHYTTASAPLMPAPWTMWTIWQFTAKGPGEAFGSEALSIDMNRFNGTQNEFLEFAGATAVATPDPVVIPPVEESTLATRTEKLEQAVSEMKASSGGLSPQFLTQVNSIETRLTALELKVATSLAGQAAASSPAVLSMPAAAEAAVPSASTATTQAAVPGTTPEAAAATSNDTQADPALLATCITNSLNVRSGPGASYPMVAGLQFGQQVKVLKRQNGWAQIEDPAGWSSEIYLTYDEAAAPVVQQPVTEIGENAGSFAICNTSGLNVRSGPGSSFPIVGGLTYGQRIKVLNRQEGWAQIEYPTGWSNETYLSFS